MQKPGNTTAEDEDGLAQLQINDLLSPDDTCQRLDERSVLERHLVGLEGLILFFPPHPNLPPLSGPFLRKGKELKPMIRTWG